MTTEQQAGNNFPIYQAWLRKGGRGGVFRPCHPGSIHATNQEVIPDLFLSSAGLMKLVRSSGRMLHPVAVAPQARPFSALKGPDRTAQGETLGIFGASRRIEEQNLYYILIKT